MFSLLTEPRLPAITVQAREKDFPQQLSDDDIVELTYPVADFQGGAYQFLIGLLQTTYAPEDEDSWKDIWREGLDSEARRQALASIADAMQFGPQKPAFTGLLYAGK